MILHGEVANILTLALLHHPFQVACRMESIKAPWGITHAVNDVGFKTIGVINHGAHTILMLQAIGIKFCLMLTNSSRL